MKDFGVELSKCILTAVVSVASSCSRLAMLINSKMNKKMKQPINRRDVTPPQTLEMLDWPRSLRMGE